MQVIKVQGFKNCHVYFFTSIRNVPNKSFPLCSYRQRNSPKWEENIDFLTPKLGIFTFACMSPVTFYVIRVISIFVHILFRVIYTLMHIYPCLSIKVYIYAFQQSETMVVPSAMCFWIIGFWIIVTTKLNFVQQYFQRWVLSKIYFFPSDAN